MYNQLRWHAYIIAFIPFNEVSIELKVTHTRRTFLKPTEDVGMEILQIHIRKIFFGSLIYYIFFKKLT
jgi:hypothetical protein